MVRISKSIRKHIRKEKAKIRREVLGLEKREEKIDALLQRFFKKPEEVKPAKK